LDELLHVLLVKLVGFPVKLASHCSRPIANRVCRTMLSWPASGVSYFVPYTLQLQKSSSSNDFKLYLAVSMDATQRKHKRMQKRMLGCTQMLEAQTAASFGDRCKCLRDFAVYRPYFALYFPNHSGIVSLNVLFLVVLHFALLFRSALFSSRLPVVLQRSIAQRILVCRCFRFVQFWHPRAHHRVASVDGR
jgi:hypothetical protein